MNSDQLLDRQYRRTLAASFSPGVLRDIATSGSSPLLSEVLTSSGLRTWLPLRATLRQIFQSIYELLSRGHRPEYVYKNAVVTKRLIGRHSVRTTPLLTEFRAGPRRADLVILNGTSSAYEVKSDFDNFDRLPGQMAYYLKTFDHVYLVTGPKHIRTAHEMLPASVGILELTTRYTLTTHREATDNAANIVPELIFDSLRKDEYTAIIQDSFGVLPSVSNIQLRSACKDLFCSMPRKTCHDSAFAMLRQTRQPAIDLSVFETIPHALRALVLSSRPDVDSLKVFIDRLDTPYCA